MSPFPPAANDNREGSVLTGATKSTTALHPPLTQVTEAPAGDGSVDFVFLHGFAGSPRSWSSVVNRLATPADCLVETLIGHENGGESGTPPIPLYAGRSPADGELFESEVDRLARRIRLASRTPVHLVGYSLGARLALGLLLRHPELFSRATLIGVNPGIEDEDARRQRRAADERWARLLETQGMSGFIPAWESQELFANQGALPAQIRESERARRLRHDPLHLAQSMRALSIAEMPNYWPRLAEIKIPVTLLVGGRDQKFRGIALRVAALLPRAELRVVENAGHNLLLEKPESVAAVLNGRSING